MKELINVYRPTIKRKDLEHVLNCMMLDNVDYGEFAGNFEDRLKNRTGIKHSLVINSFFNAFYLILEALELQENDEVLIPSFAPQIYLNVILLKKLKPVLVDISKETLMPSIEDIRKKITEKTKALIIKYNFGYFSDPKEYINLVPYVIEDISSVPGGKIEDISLGKFGKYSIADFSKKGLITTGEGAAVFCDNQKAYSKIISLLEVDYSLEYQPKFSCLMPDLNAAMGISQDETLNHRLSLRSQIGKIYIESLKRSNGASLIMEENDQRFYSDFPALFKSSLKETIKYFRKNDIEVIRPYEFPLHQYLQLNKSDFPNTEYLYLNTLLIPIHSSLLKKEVDLISKVVASLI